MKIQTLAAVVGLSTLPFASLANTHTEGFSLQGAIGSFEQKLSFEGESESGSDIGFGIRASYQFTPYLSLDAGYFDFGTYDESYVDGYGDRVTTEVSSDALQLGVTGFYPVNDSFRLLARGGLAFWDARLDIIEHDAPEFSLSVGDSGNDFYFAVGAEYWVNQNLAIGIEYMYLDIDATVVVLPVSNEVSGFMGTIRYAF